MKSIIKVIFLCALAGLCASFISPAVPHQPHQKEALNVQKSTQQFAFIDPALDNDKVENDENIEAARKCGFCIGVS